LLLQNGTFLNWAFSKYTVVTKDYPFGKIEVFQVEGPILLLLLFIVTEKSNAMFSSIGFGPMNFPKSYEKVHLNLGKAGWLL
jgi:hypothetical protein